MPTAASTLTKVAKS